MTSFSFVDWLKLMIYSGVPLNYIAFFAIVCCLLYLIPTAIFIVLEIVAYFKIRKNNNSYWAYFILAKGIKNAVIDLSAVHFLIASFILHKENSARSNETAN